MGSVSSNEDMFQCEEWSVQTVQRSQGQGLLHLLCGGQEVEPGRGGVLMERPQLDADDDGFLLFQTLDGLEECSHNSH